MHAHAREDIHNTQGARGYVQVVLSQVGEKSDPAGAVSRILGHLSNQYPFSPSLLLSFSPFLCLFALVLYGKEVVYGEQLSLYVW